MISRPTALQRKRFHGSVSVRTWTRQCEDPRKPGLLRRGAEVDSAQDRTAPSQLGEALLAGGDEEVDATWSYDRNARWPPPFRVEQDAIVAGEGAEEARLHDRGRHGTKEIKRLSTGVERLRLQFERVARECEIAWAKRVLCNIEGAGHHKRDVPIEVPEEFRWIYLVVRGGDPLRGRAAGGIRSSEEPAQHLPTDRRPSAFSFDDFVRHGTEVDPGTPLSARKPGIGQWSPGGSEPRLSSVLVPRTEDP